MPLTTPKLNLNIEQSNLAWIAINQATHIGIISHRNPDPDSIGSNLALRETISRLGKTVDSLCVHNPPDTCKTICTNSPFQELLDINKYDLLISVDCGSLSQVAFTNIHAPEFKGTFINIDHHASNNNFGHINLVYTNASSTAEIIYNLLKHWQQPITPHIATCLLFGLYYDTGSFMHSNVTPQVLDMASDLTAHGASINSVFRSLYQNFHLHKYHLWGHILENTRLSPNNTTVTVVTPDQLDKFQTVPEDLSGLIGYLNTAENSDFTVMIHQDKQNTIKGSLRTHHDHINLSDLAGQFGGGGHRKASGFSFPGNIATETFWTVKQ